ncbi:hypothetical protein [Collimonas sp.]|uniref:hypothetical protein n=1 Tax=Collimonas sp. TaxID=1963772 RepID=UPI002CB1FD31|nr:hypothetical protein [Collimonas sp.]HWW05650.1 hypothetical protein [Collimonas sp.]
MSWFATEKLPHEFRFYGVIVGTGYPYWYRVYYSVPGKPWEDLVCKDGDGEAFEKMRERMAFSEWVSSWKRGLPPQFFNQGGN